jgi:hypothetical protein
MLVGIAPGGAAGGVILKVTVGSAEPTRFEVPIPGVNVIKIVLLDNEMMLLNQLLKKSAQSYLK